MMKWYRKMKMIRRLEEKIIDFEKEGMVNGKENERIGKEDDEVGEMQVMKKDEKINGKKREKNKVMKKMINEKKKQDLDIIK